MVIVLLPTFRGMLWLAVPEVTADPLTCNEANPLDAVGLTEIAETVLLTLVV
jgi:hypothetical protein